jgi:xanthine dehydrogenase small subunit
MDVKPLRFIRRGDVVTLHGVPPDRTLLDLLREDLAATGTKEGCGEGDCGACTVVVAEPADGGLRWRAINSCIRLAHSVDGLALWTVEDLAAADGTLHPAQAAMVQCHGSQCGFCTPGFVMSLFGMYQGRVARGETITRDTAQADLSGNLCRCTGYRPILDAACHMGTLPPVPVDEARLLAQLHDLARPAPTGHDGAPGTGTAYLAPTRLPELLALRAAHPQAQVVAGCTDVGLWVTKQHRRYDQVLDVTRTRELRGLADTGAALSIGAAVPLADAFDALVARRPQLLAFARRFAGLTVRNSGTLGGNIANGSPIGDSMPLLIALGATLVLASVRGERALPIEDFFLAYRRTALAADEVVARIEVPHPAPGEFLRAFKVSKRYDDDISAVCLVVNLRLQAGQVAAARLGAGGVAAIPARATQAEAALAGQPWTEAAARAAGQALQAQFSPISDMRASADYRRALLANLMRRLWLESQDSTLPRLETPGALEALA